MARRTRPGPAPRTPVPHLSFFPRNPRPFIVTMFKIQKLPPSIAASRFPCRLFRSLHHLTRSAQAPRDILKARAPPPYCQSPKGPLRGSSSITRSAQAPRDLLTAHAANPYRPRPKGPPEGSSSKPVLPKPQGTSRRLMQQTRTAQASRILPPGPRTLTLTAQAP